jgi:hypothetical protein
MTQRTFQLYDQVMIHACGDPLLDGLVCKVLGIAFDHRGATGLTLPDHYIIELPYSAVWGGNSNVDLYLVKAIQMTEACLRKVN